MDHKRIVNMYDLLSDLSDSNVKIMRARDILYLFGEQLDDELEALQKEKQMDIDYFMNRYRLLRSLLDAVEIQLADTTVSLAETMNDMKCIIQK